MEMENTANLIHVERARKRMTLKELSKLTGISDTYLNFLENGKRRSINMKIYASICSALEIPRIHMIEAITQDLKSEIIDAWEEL